MRTPSSSAPTPRSGRGGGPESGVAAPKAMLAELSSARATSSQMLRAGRPGHMRSRSLMRRSVFPRGLAARRPASGSRHQLSDDAGSPSVHRHSRPPADAVTRGSRQIRRRQRTTHSEDLMITVSGLTKQYGGRTVVDADFLYLQPRAGARFLGPPRARK